MDDRKHPISSRTLDGRSDADAGRTDSVREGSSVVYFGDAQRIREGFAVALRVMGVGADILPADPAPPNTSSKRKDH